MAKENLEMVVDALANGMNVLYKVTHGAGIWAAFPLISELSGLNHVTGAALKAEILALSAEDRQALEDRFKAKLSFEDKVLEMKVESGADLLNVAVDVVVEAQKVYADAESLVGRAKALFA